MISRIAKTPAKIAPASSGPRQLRSARSAARLSTMVQQPPLILSVTGDGPRGEMVGSIPDPIEESQTDAQSFGNLRPCLDGCLRTPPPAAGELIEILAIGAI